MKTKNQSFSEIILQRSRVLADYLKEYPGFFETQKDQLDCIYNTLEKSRAIHVYGKGRTANSAISLALRLKHFGYNVWFIGDVIKERIKETDCVILFSGSGETSEVVNVAKQAKADQAQVVAVTSYKNATLNKYADLTILLPGGLEKRKGWEYLEAQLSPFAEEEPLFYGGGEFETIAYLFQETLISSIGKYNKIPSNIVIKEHERNDIFKVWSQHNPGNPCSKEYNQDIA